MVLALCATARLAEALRKRIPPDAGTTWPTPAALTLGAWLGRLLEDALLQGACAPVKLLDAACERLLWEQVIADALPADALPLFDLAGLAAAAQEAHALCLAWDLDPAAAALGDEARLFLAWRREFARRTKARGWTETARLPGIVCGLIESGAIALPEAIAFTGFDRYTPQETRLRRALAARGVAVTETTAESAPAVAQTLACNDADAEVRAVAAWARDRLAAHPGARLGIVVPDLATRRDALAFALDDLLHPEAVYPGAEATPRIYNFSLGRPLAGEPLVAAAFDLLALGVAHRHEWAAFSALLRSPFWSAGQSEADARARIDAALRDELEFFTDLPAVIAAVKRLYGCKRVAAPRLAAHLGAFADAVAAGGPRRRAPSAWGEAFRRWLAALDWPGDRSLSSAEFQARQAFLAALDGLGRYDELLPAVTAGEARRRLAEICAERVFQPETRGNPAIEILGVLESTGLAFDALWVMGMNDDAWPPPPRPNPLLPAEIQRRAGTPHASAEVELAFAQAVHRRLLTAAPAITFSWRRQDGARFLRPSPLIADLPVAPEAAPLPPAPLPPPLEALIDTRGPAVPPGEKVSGGTGLLKAQAICPAWGFYQYRLGAQALREPVEGLDPMARGVLVHGALEHFWGATGSLAGLRALSAEGRGTAIAAAAAAALDAFEAASGRRLPPRFRRLEGRRLERLLAVWLTVEEGRSEDFEVVAREREVEVDLDAIHIRTVIDRLDRLADGRVLVLDYKTGKNLDARNWSAARLSEPQLPFYAAIAAPLTGGADVAGAAFARVRSDVPGFVGVAAEEALLPGVAGLDNPRRKLFPADAFPDWPAVLAHWDAALRAIAAEIGAGEAAVRVADAKALERCDVLPLLRLAEWAAAFPDPLLPDTLAP